jgi:AhpD family alkylhydroperoxidase
MLRRIVLRKLDSVEKELGVSVDYLRHVARTSLRAFFKFVRIMPLAEYRRRLPPGPYHVARIAATRQADCGTCVQIEANLARKAGLDPRTILAAAEGRVGDLAPELADAYAFAEAVVRSTGEEDALRRTLRERYGEEGFVELAMAIAICRVFPETKRALGYATSCSKVKIAV